MSRKRLSSGERLWNDFVDRILGPFVGLMFLALFGWMYLHPDKAKTYGYIALAAVLVLLVIVIIIVVLLKRRKKQPVELSTEKDVLYMLRGMPWNKFEEKVSEIFSNLGYQNVEVVGGTGDHGIDIKMKNEGKEYFVQCKHYLDSIGEPAIRDFYGAITSAYAEKGFFITTSDFTDPAIKFAEENPRIELINGEKLAELYKNAKNNLKK